MSDDIAKLIKAAMGKTLIPGSTTISARLVINRELINAMAQAALTALQERGDAVVKTSGECICPKCGIRHGVTVSGDSPF